ncbi:hypothetical protein F442_13224 [Phytophthora nicotianae P10297]|uniref:Uncharacterized protein n=1 Tax=Phytophthora nicotianae P10297 TaxID=1317064 RepID=W2YWX7_PHYNI|nr:hypothetical protein F442_13224 [Phytophthora nicotianae P10297]
MELAEGYLGITHDDWLGAAHRGLNWGVHDDLSFQILGDLLVTPVSLAVTLPQLGVTQSRKG